MKYILIALLFVASPNISRANFSGMSYIESPVAPVEYLIDDILVDSKLRDAMIAYPTDYKNLKQALLKGCSSNRNIFGQLVKVRDQVLPQIKGLPIDEQEQKYNLNQNLIKTTAIEFGYIESNQ